MPSTFVRCSEFPLQVHHVVKVLGVSARMVRYWAESGKLPAIKNGPKIWCFRRQDVEHRRQEMQREADSRAAPKHRSRPRRRTGRAPRIVPHSSESRDLSGEVDHHA
jgi:excisionase family DNA binding protein